MKKIRSKIIIAALIMVVFMSVFTACGGGGQASGPQGTTAAAATGEDKAGGAYPKTFTDALGTQVTIEKEPVAIVSLTLGTDEMLVGNSEVSGLVDKSRVLSVTIYSDDPSISNITEDVKTIPNRLISGATENIIAAGPDLVFTDTWADAAFVKQLRDAGIAVFVFKTPSSVTEQINTVKEIAAVVGAEEEGVRIVGWMESRLKAVADKLSLLKEDEKLTVMEYSEMFTTSGTGTNFDSVVTTAGLINVASKAGLEGWPAISKEKVVEMNPDIILLPSWYYDKNNTLEIMAAGLKNDRSLTGVSAVANGRLVSVPNPHISAISQYVVHGVEDVAKTAYPQLFK